jgi:hypothetical protein
MTTKLSKQTINLPQLILRLAELGLDEGEIMYSLELTRRKFNALKRQKSISDALTTGLETRARRVEDALYRRATGFEYEEIRTVSTLSGRIEGDKKTKTISPLSGGIEGDKKTKTTSPLSEGIEGGQKTTSSLPGGKEGGQKTETSASAKSTKKSGVSKSPSSGGSKGGVTLKTVPPDVTACIFWLKNRLPDKWREGKELTTGKKPFIEALELYDKTHETD